MIIETNYAIAIAALSDWLKNLALVFQLMRSETKTNRIGIVRAIFPAL